MDIKKILKEKWPYLFLLLVAFAVPVLVSSRYVFQVIVISVVWSVAALSLNLVLGYTGLASLAHAGFFGIGAYGVALLTRGGMSFWLALPLSALLATVVGLFIAMPALRTRESYFAISTLCFGVIIYIVAGNWLSLTGGHTGIIGIPRVTPIRLPFLTIEFTSLTSQYYLVLVLLLLTLFVMHRLVYSLQGLTFMSIRNNEVLAEAVGINAFSTKLLSFCIANFIVALAGGVYAPLMGSISPTVTMHILTFNWLVFTLLGGVATLAGPIIGAFAITVLIESLYFLGEYQLIIFGALLIVVIIYFPRGLMGIYDNLSLKAKDFYQQRRSGFKDVQRIAQSRGSD
ncbi:MAG: branched-chain amino acid ABC transporter permease [Dethiobacter sp.]|jgi:branched-chain amino acid transport system permease protein|nr:branched-chain amino acid ABC transporter permease [Dethiobacter sp.]